MLPYFLLKKLHLGPVKRFEWKTITLYLCNLLGYRIFFSIGLLLLLANNLSTQEILDLPTLYTNTIYKFGFKISYHSHSSKYTKPLVVKTFATEIRFNSLFFEI